METIKIKKAPATIDSVKTKRGPKEKKEPTEPIQKFFIEHTDNSITIKFDGGSFGLRKRDGKLESFMSNTDNKENNAIQTIQKTMKQYNNQGVSFKQIAERFNVAIHATSYKIFINKINKPVEGTTN